MELKTIHQLSVATAVGMTLSLLMIGKAQAYTFTKIADIGTQIPNTNASLNSLGSFSINNSGTVAFTGGVPGRHGSGGGVFTGDGEQLTTIFFSRDTRIGDVNINDKGDVAFWNVVGSPRLPNAWDLVISSDGLTTPIYRVPIPFHPAGFSMNNEGTVAILDIDYCCRSGMRRNDFLLTISADGEQTPIANTSAPFESLSSPALNDIGTVAFRASLDGGGQAIFTSNGGDYTTIANTSGSFRSLSFPAINNAATVAFSAGLDAGGGGIFTSSGGDYTTIVNSSGLFDGFSGPAINNVGTVAFGASLDAGGYGIFTGADPITDKVITTGDTLFGSTVTGLTFSPKGFNDAGQIAFIASFGDDSRQGLFRADPEAQLPTSVPEPGSIVGLGLLGLSTFLMRKRALS
jgi:hypothetical protein